MTNQKLIRIFSLILSVVIILITLYTLFICVKLWSISLDVSLSKDDAILVQTDSAWKKHNQIYEEAQIKRAELYNSDFVYTAWFSTLTSFLKLVVVFILVCSSFKSFRAIFNNNLNIKKTKLT